MQLSYISIFLRSLRPIFKKPLCASKAPKRYRIDSERSSRSMVAPARGERVRLMQSAGDKTLEDSKMQESQSPTRKTNGRWTREEHLKFLQGLRVYGKNWKKIEQLVETRTGSQIRSHAQKFFLKTQQMALGQYGSLSLEDSGAGEAQEPTLISKSGSEYGGTRENCSFFLGRIMDHWQDKQCLDFWKSLVDSKDATENSKGEKKNNSFTRMKVFSCDNMELHRPAETYF